MFVASNVVPLFLVIFISCHESETASTAFVTKPSDPSHALEGRDFTLEWIYTLDGTIGSAQVFNVSVSGRESVGKTFGPGNLTFDPKYQAGFRGQATNTRVVLTILAVQRSDGTKYQVNVVPTGTGGLQDEVTVIVQYQPKLTFLSVNQTVNDGDVVWLNCTAEGFPAPNITWTRLSSNRDVQMPMIIRGKQDEGVYRCTADNGIGNSVTADVFVTVQYQPNLTFISVNQTVNDGDVVWLNCTADGFPAPTIIWTRFSANRAVQMPMTITGKQDEGVYRCTADNGIGSSVTADVFVTVEFYRAFNTDFSTNLTNAAFLNERFYLMCSAEANPAAEYRFYREDESVANITAGSIGLYTTSVDDRIKQVVYKCIPFNSFGDGPTKTLNITIHYHVEATGRGTNFIVAKGRDQNIACPVDGNPKPNIKWYRGSNTSGTPNSTENVFTVKNVMKSVCYTCVANNSLGTAVSISHCLIVVEPTRTMVSSTAVSQLNTTAPTKPPIDEPEGSGSSTLAIIGAAAGGVVALAIVVGVLTWWVHKQRKCRKDTKSKDQTLLASRQSHENRQQSCFCWPTYKCVISNV